MPESDLFLSPLLSPLPSQFHPSYTDRANRVVRAGRESGAVREYVRILLDVYMLIGLYLCSIFVKSHHYWFIGNLYSSSIMLYSKYIIAYNQHTNNGPSFYNYNAGSDATRGSSLDERKR